jgi:hypothetical protein
MNQVLLLIYKQLYYVLNLKAKHENVNFLISYHCFAFRKKKTWAELLKFT